MTISAAVVRARISLASARVGLQVCDSDDYPLLAQHVVAQVSKGDTDHTVNACIDCLPSGHAMDLAEALISAGVVAAVEQGLGSWLEEYAYDYARSSGVEFGPYALLAALAAAAPQQMQAAMKPLCRSQLLHTLKFTFAFLADIDTIHSRASAVARCIHAAHPRYKDVAALFASQQELEALLLGVGNGNRVQMLACAIAARRVDPATLCPAGVQCGLERALQQVVVSREEICYEDEELESNLQAVCMLLLAKAVGITYAPLREHAAEQLGRVVDVYLDTLESRASSFLGDGEIIRCMRFRGWYS